jgi:predicted phosphodiesterase
MRLQILSDLHLTVAGLEPPRTAADVVVLAGDIARPRQAVAWASGFEQRVLYVPGNHEFYGGSIDGTTAELRELCAGTNVTLLERDEVVLDGVRFLGTTLWTDFRLDGDGAASDEAMRVAQALIRDFSRIRREAAAPEAFSPADSAALFDRQAAWLKDRLASAHDGPTVVITHHAPSPRSIHPRFAASPLNAAFVSNGAHLLDGRRACLWIHGHTHDSFDRAENGLRVLCNPRGYAKDGVNENARFDPELTIDLATSRPLP